jgi:preprotein translocase subunit SecG
MFLMLSIIILFICALLLMVVLVQNSKGGGLAANFSGSQIMGVRRTADFLEKATWTLAAALVVLSIMASWAIPKPQVQNETRIEKQIDNNNFDPSTLPNIPTNVPDDGTDKKDK